MDLLIYNPKAGKGNAKQHLEKFPQAQKLQTTGNNDVDRIRNALTKKHKRLIVIGGDGTVHSAVQAIIGRDISLQVVPAGSSNSFYEEIQKSKPQAIDVLKINEIYCVHLAGFGLNAKIIKKSEKSNKSGIWKYLGNLFSSLFSHGATEFVVGKKSLRTKLLIIANGCTYQGKFPINPKGNMSDGKFELCTLKDQESVTSAVIENVGKAPFHIDGEFYGHPKKVKVTLLKQELRLSYTDN